MCEELRYKCVTFVGVPLWQWGDGGSFSKILKNGMRGLEKYINTELKKYIVIRRSQMGLLLRETGHAKIESREGLRNSDK